MFMTLKIAVLGSTKGTDMQAIIDSIERNDLDARISVVISNKEDAYILERARKHGIEAIYIDHNGKTREDFDREMAEEIDKMDVDLILLIGFMRILSEWFCGHYENRIVNIHPSLIPAFEGGMDINVHEEVIKRGCRVSGCTLHFVTENVDRGPIIMQKPVMVDNDETPETLKDKVQKAEQECFIEAIRKFSEGKIVLDNGRVKIL
ncbi:MAG: phosphoribosylglycinamide formyltransferase [Candidatus Aenigmarchaeota archaeon]|nr:phosphoribosylglycinamide formyltransferase [Candidatus Aenigmarchaeota archaeon]